MPEKTAAKVETNGVPKPEVRPEKVAETARTYAREAESTARDVVRMYNDLLSTTTKYYYDAVGNNIRGTMEIAAKTQRNMEDVLTIYRKVYTEGFKAWQTYLDEVSKVFPFPRLR